MTKELSIHIEGMSCSGCAQTVKEILLSLEECEEVKVDHEKDEGRVKLADSSKLEELKKEIKEEIEKEGYQVKGFS